MIIESLMMQVLLKQKLNEQHGIVDLTKTATIPVSTCDENRFCVCLIFLHSADGTLFACIAVTLRLLVQPPGDNYAQSAPSAEWQPHD